MLLRDIYEKKEKERLSSFAVFSSNSKGRQTPEKKCDVRTDFQRDRDRIIYCKSFRRLKHKTQVFISPEGDHYRTRLTHTLEVSQIARTIARSLSLNEDLTEAIALGHDLGHTPFGHAGERILNEVCPLGFKHNKQSVRVVENLAKDRNGLNLTWEVRDGIKCHTGTEQAKTLEGQIIKFADRIAYINHDIEDAIRGKVLDPSSLPKNCVKVLGETSSHRINNMIINIIINSLEKPYIKMDDEFQQATDELRKFMFKNVYVGSSAKKEEVKAERMLKELYSTFVKTPELMPEQTRKFIDVDGLHLTVCDYIAGMTDRYAVNAFSSIYIPAAWELV